MYHQLWPHRAVRVLHCTEGTSNKLYIVRVDEVQGQYKVIGSYGKAQGGGYLKDHIKLTTHTKAQAKNALWQVAEKKLNGGYEEITYSWDKGVTAKQALAKIDTSRIVALTSHGDMPDDPDAEPATEFNHPAAHKPKPPEKPEKTEKAQKGRGVRRIKRRLIT